MPRNASNIYSKPPGTTPIVNDDVDPVPFNLLMDDIATDLNTPRPIVAGGTGASSAEAALVNLGLTATAAEINTLDGITATTAELNILDGVTATAAELNVLDGVTGLIGWGQTWQNVSGSRAVNTSYQNTTGRPIMVSVTAFGATQGQLQMSSDNSAWVGVSDLGRTVGGTNYTWGAQAVVPNNYYYRVSGATTLAIWAELR